LQIFTLQFISFFKRYVSHLLFAGYSLLFACSEKFWMFNFIEHDFKKRNDHTEIKLGSRVPLYASGFILQPCRVTLHPGLNGQ